MKNIYFISCHFFFYNKTVNTNMRAITDYEFNKHTQNNGKNQINISQCNKKKIMKITLLVIIYQA